MTTNDHVRINADTLAHHLAIAANRYTCDAQIMDSVNQPKLAEEFRQQAKQALEWADALTNRVNLYASEDAFTVLRDNS